MKRPEAAERWRARTSSGSNLECLAKSSTANRPVVYIYTLAPEGWGAGGVEIFTRASPEVLLTALLGLVEDWGSPNRRF
jgi:hypothetical protein